ncbi:copper resistance protein NlpE [Phenylobacterium sp.]|jgi:copper homeostasis protein (lipoprotein)|uniref:copper resistance protein NlpE n=1 Tax=Phenylobacterium sp. TaxID=1871053 RepID=UPI002E2F211A|nr:copper resistance protein NlpE [Phenylobacterium sp.]HEX2560317.1 copper resistance protein NlpE [Phenylobacterium sp.]
MKSLLPAAVALALTACASPPAPNSGAPQVGTYEGVLPCADCPGIRTRLTLEGPPGHRYRLEQTYLERSQAPFVEEGVYYILRGNAVDPDATVFELGADSRNYVQRVGPDELLKLDSEMRPIPSSADLSLRRIP